MMEKGKETTSSVDYGLELSATPKHFPHKPKTAAQTCLQRLNVFEHLKRFCQACTNNFYFWCAVALFAIAEPILCSNYPTPLIIDIQVGVLFISSVIFFVQIIGVATTEWEKIIALQNEHSTVQVSMKDMPLLKLLIFFTSEGEYTLEGFCLALGWMLIFFHPGIAILRCFRVFRLLWFYEVTVFKSNTEVIFNPLMGEKFVSRVFNVLKFAIKALTALGNEMFRLADGTRGGIILMAVFFYSAFVLGAALWIETDRKSDLCTNLGSCSFVLMRLTFYDGDGFDFALFLANNNHRMLFVVVMMYMCITSFGILNGLVGIFGSTFANASQVAFGNDDDEYDETTVMDDDSSYRSGRGSFKSGHSGSFIADDESVHTFSDDGMMSSHRGDQKAGSGKKKITPQREQAISMLNQTSVDSSVLGSPIRLISEEGDLVLESCSAESDSATNKNGGGTRSNASSIPKPASRRPSNAHTHHPANALPSFLGGYVANTPGGSSAVGSPVPKPSKKATYSDLLALNKMRQKSFRTRSRKPQRIVPVDFSPGAPPSLEHSPKSGSVRPTNNFFLNGYPSRAPGSGDGRKKLQHAFEVVKQAKLAQQRAAAQSPVHTNVDGEQLKEDVDALKEDMKKVILMQSTMHQQMNQLLSVWGLPPVHDPTTKSGAAAALHSAVDGGLHKVGEILHKGKEVAAAVVGSGAAAVRMHGIADDGTTHYPADDHVTIPHKAAMMLGTKSQYFNEDGEDMKMESNATAAGDGQHDAIETGTDERVTIPHKAAMMLGTKSQYFYDNDDHDQILNSDDELSIERCSSNNNIELALHEPHSSRLCSSNNVGGSIESDNAPKEVEHAAAAPHSYAPLHERYMETVPEADEDPTPVHNHRRLDKPRVHFETSTITLNSPPQHGLRDISQGSGLSSSAATPVTCNSLEVSSVSSSPNPAASGHSLLHGSKIIADAESPADHGGDEKDHTASTNQINIDNRSSTRSSSGSSKLQPVSVETINTVSPAARNDRGDASTPLYGGRMSPQVLDQIVRSGKTMFPVVQFSTTTPAPGTSSGSRQPDARTNSTVGTETSFSRDNDLEVKRDVENGQSAFQSYEEDNFGEGEERPSSHANSFISPKDTARSIDEQSIGDTNDSLSPPPKRRSFLSSGHGHRHTSSYQPAHKGEHGGDRDGEDPVKLFDLEAHYP